MDRRDFLKSSAVVGTLATLPAGIQARGVKDDGDIAANADWIQDAVDAATSQGASYAEVLSMHEHRESIQLRKEDVHTLSDSSESGYCLRVFKDGAWGTAVTAAWEAGRAKDLAMHACSAADAVAAQQRLDNDPASTRGDLGEQSWETPVEIDPFKVPVEEKIAFLRELTTYPLKIQQIPYSVANLFMQESTRLLVNSAGSRLRQKHVMTYPNFAVTAFHQKLRRMDSRSSSFEAQSGGWEITKRNFKSDLETAMQEVLRTQTAEPVKEGKYQVVLHPSVLWDVLFETLLPHFDPRSVMEIDGRRPGDAWLRVADIGNKRIGPASLQLEADMTLADGLATGGWDDSGRPALRMPLLTDGVFSHLPWDDTLPALPAGIGFPCTRTAHWSEPAGPSMPNIIMQEGTDGDLNDLISGVDDGLYVKGRGSIVTNPQRTLFRLKPQAAWMIKGGKTGDMVRGVEIETSVEQFWNAIVAIGSGKETMTAGDLFPSRANPLWSAPFSVSVPPTLFADVPVYAAREQS